jgi:ABC-type polysaccharide/polyol phosphate export permease
MVSMSGSDVYDSERQQPPMIEEFVQICRYRDLITQLIRRDVLTRYKRSVLGVAWTMLNPLGMMFVLAVAFSSLLGATRHFPVYILTGLVVWNFFAQSTVLAMTQFVWGGALLHRIYVPRTVFAVSAVGTGVVNLALSLVPLAVVMVVIGTPLRPAVLILPIAVLLVAMFALGFGLLVSTLAVPFSDVAEMYQIALQAWFFLTPIIYPEQVIPDGHRWWMFELNPMYHLVKLFRLSLYHGRWPDGVEIAVAACISIITLLVGWVVFTRKADELAYHV